ncbi:hypothetical protein [Corynebacterium lubricantis]|uniref:hypothetical protein n=1 Tax=Corynebacterium lubricantis TaxID=541095 RepID=UPI00036CFC1B|nr:hypothetical protein [Corynebacterium lubricantis]
MNLALIRQGYSVARDVLDTVNDYREQKQREAFDALQEAADNFDADELRERGQDLFDESRREAGKLTQAAHRRLDKTRATIADRAQDASKQVEARATQVADKVTGKEAKREKRRKNTRRALSAVGIVALLSAIAAAVYYFFFASDNKQKEERTTPPRVEEHSTEKDSKLVYSTTSDKAAEKASAGPLGEEPAERDEELLESLEEQLETLADDGGAADDLKEEGKDAASDPTAFYRDDFSDEFNKKDNEGN